MQTLEQQGPWAGKAVRVTPDWYIEALRRRIEEIDWETAKNDISRFASLREQRSIDLWSSGFFLYQLDRFVDQMTLGLENAASDQAEPLR